MAQFVVTWSLFLYAFCLSLSNCDAVAQQVAKVPLFNNNVVDGVHENGNVVVGGGVANAVAAAVGSIKEKERTYHPAAVSKPRIIDQYDHRGLDGNYEFRYLLSNGEARYERAYWIPAGENVVLARKGYYSYRLKDSKYRTVFYTADQNGYREDSTTYSKSQPTLPRSIQVPEYMTSSSYGSHTPVAHRPSTSHHVYTSTTTRKPYIQPTRNPFLQLHPSSVHLPSIHQSGAGNQVFPLYGHQSHGRPSSTQSSLAAHSSVGGHHYPSETHSSSGHHHSTGAHSSSGIHSSSGFHHSAVAQSAGAYPSIANEAGHSSGIYTSLNIPASEVQSSSGVQPSAGVHSQHSGVHSSSGGHSQHSGVQPSAGVHSQHSGAHSSSGGHSQHSGVQSSSGGQAQHSGAHSSSGGHLQHTGVHSSTGGHSQHTGVHTSSGVHPQHTGVHSSSGGQSQHTGLHTSSGSHSQNTGVHSSSGGHSHAGISSSVPIPSPPVAQNSWGVQTPSGVLSSSAVHSLSGVHSSAGIHSDLGPHSSAAVHSPSVVHTSGAGPSQPNIHHSSGVFSSSGHYSTVSPSVQAHPSHQHQISATISTVRPTKPSHPVPVQSWHYNF